MLKSILNRHKVYYKNPLQYDSYDEISDEENNEISLELEQLTSDDLEIVKSGQIRKLI